MTAGMRMGSLALFRASQLLNLASDLSSSFSRSFERRNIQNTSFRCVKWQVRRRVWRGTSEQFPQRRIRNGKDTRLSGFAVTAVQNSFHLFRQCSQHDLRKAVRTGRFYRCVNAPQVHIRRHDEGHTLIQSIVHRPVSGRRNVVRLQDDSRQKFTVIWNTHDAELQAARVIAWQQKQRQLQTVVDFTIGLQACVVVILYTIQFGKDLLVAGRGKIMARCFAGIAAV